MKYRRPMYCNYELKMFVCMEKSRGPEEKTLQDHRGTFWIKVSRDTKVDSTGNLMFPCQGNPSTNSWPCPADQSYV